MFLHGFPKSDNAEHHAGREEGAAIHLGCFWNCRRKLWRRRCRSACYWRCAVSKIIESLRGDLTALHEAGAIGKVTMARVRRALLVPGAGVQRCRHQAPARRAEIQLADARTPPAHYHLDCAQVGARRNPSHGTRAQTAQRHRRQGLAGHYSNKANRSAILIAARCKHGYDLQTT